MKNLRIVLVQYDKVLRDGYAFLLEAHQHISIINTYATAEQAAENCMADGANLYMIDITRMGQSGIEAIMDIKRKCPHSDIIIMTLFETMDFIKPIFSGIGSGYVSTNSPVAKIIETIFKVVGENTKSTSITKRNPN